MYNENFEIESKKVEYGISEFVNDESVVFPEVNPIDLNINDLPF